MPRIIRRERASEDLDECWSARALQQGENSANGLIFRIERRLSLLADFPETGTKRDELRPGLRSVTIGKLVLFYFPLRDGVELVRVIDGRRDIQTIFEDEEDDDENNN